jgi:predicted transglutaminase-like cysteine proteinase
LVRTLPALADPNRNLKGKKLLKCALVNPAQNGCARGRGGNLLAIFALIWACILLTGPTHASDPLGFSTRFTQTNYLLAAHALQTVTFIDDRRDSTAPASLGVRDPGKSGLLFGMDADPVAGGELAEKWHRVEDAMAEELAVVAQCRANGNCPPVAQRLMKISAEGAGRSGRARVGLINRAADLAIRPISDEAQWGVADHWSDPFETLLTNRGDCEDYAILKYAALLEAGISNEDVKIVILKYFFPSQTHAAVATRVDGQWLMLDNRTLALVRDMDVRRAIPEFVLNHEGVKRFNWASRSRHVAS